jgi:pyruvate,water dikinase
MLASFVPLALILGPMVMSFSWLPARVDPASWNPQPGATVFVTATVDGDYTGPVVLSTDPALSLAENSAAEQRNPPIRSTLEKLRARWQIPSENTPELSWEVRAAGAKIRDEMLADLNLYLKEKIPARDLAWTLHTPSVAGRYTLSITSGTSSPIVTHAVLGDQCPPEPKEDLGDGKGPVQIAQNLQSGSPVQRVRVVYKEQRTLNGKLFWQPFARFGSHWSAGWLLTYISVYLPVMLLFRWLLRIP